VVNVGGLYVIGTERHEARRIDNQLRGRSGRQGDPGSSRFFVSFEDELMRRFGGDRMKSIMETLKIPESEAIENKMLSNIIEEAQNRVEGFNFDARKHLLEYDDVKNKHRETFYKKRQDVLRKTAKDSDDPDSLALMAKETLEKNGYSLEQYQKKEETIGKDNMRQLEKAVFLMVMDGLWLEHLENMEHLEDSVRLRAYGQQDPLVEYKTEGHKAFQRLMETMETEIAAALFKFQVSTEPKKDFGQPLAQPVSGRKEPGRNDPCPCGAVKADGHPVKYKHCHGKN